VSSDAYARQSVTPLEQLPRSLRRSLINLMAREELEDAYERAATLLDEN